MANDIIDINVYETNDSVAITVEPNLTTINITQVNAGNGNVPVGGTAGQVLAKIDSANFNTQWVNQSGGGGGISDAPNDANAYVRSALSWVIGYTKSAIDTLLNNKVDKVTGKGLSTEDYTSTEKTKLSGIASGAEVNVNADWNATSGDAQILNKPTIPTATNQITNNGADGVNPFITALDIPTAGQAGTLVREVKNMTGATLTKGTVVYISGANGNKALVSKALATTDALSARTFGLLQSDILNNGLGYCVIIGDLSGVDTSSFSEGAQLYLSGTTAGTFTSTKSLAPTHLVYVGKVTRVHPTQGQIEVGIQNGYELEEIHDCQIVTPTNNQLLVYETASDLWKNKTASDVGIQPTLVSATNIKTINGISILGSGDLATFPSLSPYSMIANNTNASAIATQQAFKSSAQQTYTGTIVVTATTSPSGATNHSYSFTQVGKLVTLRINIDYANTGTLVSAIACELPSDCPTPEYPTGVTTAGDVIVYGTGTITANRALVGAMGIMALRLKTGSVFELVVTRTGASFNKAYYSIQYFTA